MLTVITTYSMLLLYYGLFLIAVYTTTKNGSGHLGEILERNGETGVLFNRLLAGILFLGTGTAHAIMLRDVNREIFEWPWDESNAFLWMIICGIAIIAGTSSALKEIFSHKAITATQPLHFSLSYTSVRVFFLIVYEFFFRGVVLFTVIQDAGIITAVLINLALYVFIHWFNKKERYGSILMGLVLCGLAIYYQSVWPAIAVHVSLALSHEITLLISYYSPRKKIRL
jgi:membrane protease YdiL (CAAX protease family)